jgi:hypothetical protein
MLAHSQGNVVASESLAKYTSAPIDTYIASQAALSASFYDNRDSLDNAPTIKFLEDKALLDMVGVDNIQFILRTPRVFGHYFSGADGVASYFSHDSHEVASKALTMCNFYNKEDWALRKDSWELNNVMRPAYGMEFIHCDSNEGEKGTFDLFEEECPPEDSVSGERFVNEYLQDGDGDEADYINDTLEFENIDDLQRYKIFSYIAHSRKRALGTQNVTGSGFTVANNVNLFEDPPELYEFDDRHYSHSRQFRSNIVNEKWYWKRVMEQSTFESSLK